MTTDLDQPVVGYRTWTPRGEALAARNIPYIWTPGINVALCTALLHELGGMPPQADCECGLHAYKQRIWNHAVYPRAYPAIVFGAVLLWGRMYSGVPSPPDELGNVIRAEKAEILALVEHPRVTPYMREYYHVSVVPDFEALRSYALEHGIELEGAGNV